jgi:hypothetical protein
MVENQVRACDVTDRRIVKAMLEVPREEFSPAFARDIAAIGFRYVHSSDGIRLISLLPERKPHVRTRRGPGKHVAHTLSNRSGSRSGSMVGPMAGPVSFGGGALLSAVAAALLALGSGLTGATPVQT